MIEPPNAIVSRNILVAVAGGSPAIVTETLWALTQQRGGRVDEVRVITTSKGESAIRAALLDPLANKLSPGTSRFDECCRECGLQGTVSIAIHTLEKTEGIALSDIRDDRENQLAADQICSLIREWASEPNTKLYCSAAGGRKSLSIYLTIAMMLYGRADDRLFHVLIDPDDFEHCKDFFHPFRKPRNLAFIDRNGKQKRLSTAKVRIDLGEIPFVKLGVLNISEISDKGQSYSEIVDSLQKRLEFLGRAAWSHVLIHPAQFYRYQIPIEVGGRRCNLPTAQGFVYALVAEDRKSEGGGVEVDLISIRDLKRVYKRLIGSEYSEAALRGTEFNFLVEWIDKLRRKDDQSLKSFKGAMQVSVSRANDALEEAFFPARFLIQNLRETKRGKQSQGAMYTINLPGDAIHLPSL